MNQDPLKSVSLMLMAAFFFASMSALVKYLGSSFPLFEIIFFRSLIAVPILTLICIKKGFPLFGVNRKLLILRGLAGFFALVTLFFAVTQISLIDLSTIRQSTPLFVILFSILFLNEKIRKLSLAWVVAALLGIALILKPEGNLFNYGGFIALLGAILASLAYILIRQLHKTDFAPVMSLYFASITVLLSFPFLFLKWKSPEIKELILLLTVGVLGTFGQLTMSYAYKFAPASFVSPFAYAGVPISFCYGFFFFDEIPNQLTLIGIALTLAACLALSLTKAPSQNYS